MVKLIILCSVTLFLFMSPLPIFAVPTYNVVSFGASTNGRTDSTQPFQRAWAAACKSAQASTVYVPRGTFLIKSVTFNGPCRNRIKFQIDGTIVAPKDYNVIGKSQFWILFYKVYHLSVQGGTIDARGASFWRCRRGRGHCPGGARSLTFMGSKDVTVSGLTSLNSQTIHIAIHQSSNIRIQKVYIRAPGLSPNTDGINVRQSNGVTITDSIIKTGDDCIAIGPGSRNFWIGRIGCGPGHGISIGSLGNNYNEEGVQNVIVSGVVFSKTQNGVRIKTLAKSSRSFATKITFQNIVMRNVDYPIIIDQNYCPEKRCSSQSHSGVKVSGVTFSNIKGSSTTQTAVRFECSASNPCQGIQMRNIKLTSYVARSKVSSPAIAYCKNVRGSHRGQVIPKACF